MSIPLPTPVSLPQHIPLPTLPSVATPQQSPLQHSQQHQEKQEINPHKLPPPLQYQQQLSKDERKDFEKQEFKQDDGKRIEEKGRDIASNDQQSLVLLQSTRYVLDKSESFDFFLAKLRFWTKWLWFVFQSNLLGYDCYLFSGIQIWFMILA